MSYSYASYRGTAVDPVGNLYAVGTFNGTSITLDGITLENVAGPSSNNDVFLVKYDTDGTAIWATNFGSTAGDWSKNVCTDESGSVYVAGTYNFSDMTIGPYTLANYGYSDAFMAKYDSNGNLIWAKNFSGTQGESIRGITIGPDGHLFVAGSTSSETVSFNGSTLSINISTDFIAKFSLGGDIIWIKDCSEVGATQVNSFEMDTQGNIYIGGEFESDTLIIGSDSLIHEDDIYPFDDFFVAKFDPEGNPVWARSAGGAGEDVVTGVAVDESQNVYISGYFTSSTISIGSTVLDNAEYQSDDIFVAKYDQNGILQWAKGYGGDGDDFARDVLVAENGDVVFTGHYAENGMYFDSDYFETGGLFVTRLDSSGELLWVKSSADNSGTGFTVDENSNGELFIAMSSGIQTFTLDEISLDFSEVNVGIIVAKLSKIAVEVSISETTCSEEDDAVATATVFYGEPPYSFTWNTVPPQYGDTAVNLASGEYSLTVTDSQNSSVTVDVLIPETDPIVTVIEETICEGEVFHFNDNYLYEAGAYLDTLIAQNGCDSILELSLEVAPIDTIPSEVTLCVGDSLEINDTFVSESGIYYKVLISSFGCDSIIEVHLSSVPNHFVGEEVSICDGQTYHVGSSIYNEPGIYNDTLLSVHGCDSVVVTDLSLSPLYYQSLNPTMCEGDTFLFNGIIYTHSGIFQDTLSTVEGCDSIFSIELSVHPTYDLIDYVDICEDSVYIFNNVALDSSGVYSEQYSTNNGCDSVEVLNLQVHSFDTIIQDYVLLDGEKLPFFGEFHSQPGTYYHTLESAMGCDSTIVANLSFKPRPTVWVPNAFIPNSEIPENRVFKVQGTGIESIDLKIFNRRGEMIFESRDLELGWDGKRGGVPMPIDVYVYRLFVLFQDGTIDSHEGIVTIKYH